MKTTLYWDSNSTRQAWSFNGEKWRFYTGKYWRDTIVQDWSSEDFDKSLTVNNFKEK